MFVMQNKSKIHLTADRDSDMTHLVTYNAALVTVHIDIHYAGFLTTAAS